MTEKGRWKIILKYTLGLVALAVAVTLAIFLPEWYSEWQDARQMAQVNFTSRESIRFLDMDSLDIAGRLKMLEEAETGDADTYWTQVDFYSQARSEIVTEEDIVERCRTQVRVWIDGGILPAACGSWLEDENSFLTMLASYVIYIDQTVLPVYVLQWTLQESGRMSVLMDAELDMIYYVSVSGTEVMEDMAERLGYESLGEMQGQLAAGEPIRTGDFSVMNADYAGICGADAAEVDGHDDNWLELDITLDFNKFNGHAFRRVVMTDSGPGYAVMYGSETWVDFITAVWEEFGWEEFEVSAAYLGDFMKPLAENGSTGENYETYEKTQILQ